MRTMIIILAGFVLLAVCIGAARLLGSNSAAATSTAVKVFIPIWFLAAAINFVIYSITIPTGQ